MTYSLQLTINKAHMQLICSGMRAKRQLALGWHANADPPLPIRHVASFDQAAHLPRIHLCQHLLRTHQDT